MSEIVVDESEYPVVVLRYPVEVTDHEFKQHLDKLGGIAQRGSPFGMVSLAGPRFPTSAQRQMIKLFGQEHAEQLQQHCVGNAVVLHSALMRGMLTVMNWFPGTQEPFVIKPFADRSAAQLWIATRLKRAKR